MVVHDVEHLPACATHVMLLKRGRVLASGPPREALNAVQLSELYDCPVSLERDARGRCRAHAQGGLP